MIVGAEIFEQDRGVADGGDPADEVDGIFDEEDDVGVQGGGGEQKENESEEPGGAAGWCGAAAVFGWGRMWGSCTGSRMALQ